MSDELTVWEVDRRVTSIEGVLNKHMNDNRDTHKDLYTRTERPPWMVVWAMGVMGSLLGGMAIYIITNV